MVFADERKNEVIKGTLLTAVGTRGLYNLTKGATYSAINGAEAGIFGTRPYVMVLDDDGKRFSCHLSRFTIKEPDLIIKVKLAAEAKPPVGAPCNNCGWCCLTEVCPVGVELTGSNEAPCNLLDSRDGKHYCRPAQSKEFRKTIGAGEGCCAETQAEVIQRLST